jgi:hypothetical protein
MAVHTDDDAVVAQAIEALVIANKAELLLDDVLYGDHNMIPHASAAIIMPGGMRRTLAGVSQPGGRTQNDMVVEVVLHWSRVGDEATERKAADARGKALERKLHEDTTLGGIIIHGFVNQTDKGNTIMGNNNMFRTVRMVFVAQTKTYLSPPAAPS